MMIGISCKNGHVFSMIINEYVDAEWKLQEMYYKAQCCSIIHEEVLRFTTPSSCEHCDSLVHEFDNLIEEIK